MAIFKNSYFIADTNRKDKKRIYQLYRKPLSCKWQELVSNIDQLKMSMVLFC